MKFPLGFQTICAASFLCFVTCCPAYAGAPLSPSGVHDDASPSRSSQAEPLETLVIPGPLRSFLRMAGISQEVSPDDVLPMLARNASLYGYQAGRETEFLVLVDRYVRQGRELLALADSSGTIHIKGCEDATRLIQVLGYKFQRTCGQKDASLVTANAERAFLTIDSGFPLTTLEQALSNGEPFSYAYPATRVPFFFTEKTWSGVTTSNKRPGEDLLDELLHDQNLDRLYAALAKCDDETRRELAQSPGLRRLATVASVFDLYGSGITIHGGEVLVP